MFEWAMKNPFLLSMLMVDPLRALDRAAKKRKEGRSVMNEADLYEVYLTHCASTSGVLKYDCKDEEIKKVMEVGEVIGCMMANSNEWQLQLGEVVARVEAVVLTKGEHDEARRLMKALPLRVEDWGDIHSALSFRHKTLAEYLCARRLLRVADSLVIHLSGRCFSQDTPNVARFFSQLKAAQPAEDFTSRIMPEYMELVRKTSDGTEEALNAASNALALIARSGATVHAAMWADAVIRDGDLRNLILSDTDLSGARFERCWLE
eukprot:Hpha_TRINITY_DN16428_c2_g4::TRINITY_DN16428_c2_g4_i1::g.163112::m.163112